MSYQEEVEGHLEKYFGIQGGVIHPGPMEQIIDPTMPHIDIHHWQPTSKRNFWVLCTCGMSHRAMNTPDKSKRYCELMMFLNPDDWNLNMHSIRDIGRPGVSIKGFEFPRPDYPIAKDKNGNKIYFENFMQDKSMSWPVYALILISRFPFMANRNIGHGHTIETNPLLSIPPYCGFLVKTPSILSDNIIKVKLKDGSVVNFYVLLPIFLTEMQCAIMGKKDKLIRKFSKDQKMEITSKTRKKIRL